jgi:hypothetical protein
MLNAPYFLDEAWVALSVKFPLGDLPYVTASTPLGWTFLLRLFPDNYLRVLPLIFHLIGVAAAYALGRQLGPKSVATSRIAGVACAGIVLLMPVQQIRHDLKQYSADAAVTLIMLALAAWTEASWSRRRLGAMIVVVALSSSLSSITVITTLCAFGGLFLVALARRQWRRLLEVTVAGVVAGAIAVMVLFTTAARGNNQQLQDYWRDYFPNVGQLPSFIRHQANGLLPLLGATRPLDALVLAIAGVLGVVTVFRWNRPSAGVAIILLPMVAVVLGVAKKYPLLDLRTSQYLFVAIAATIGLGMAGTAAFLAGLVRRHTPRRQVVVAAALSVLAVGFFGLVNHRWYRFAGLKAGVDYRTTQTREDTRGAVEYLHAHMAPNDVVVVSAMARYGFGFYWNTDPIRLVKIPGANAIGFTVGFPTQPSIVPVSTLAAADIRRALDQAFSLAQQRGAGSRVWLVRSHVQPDELQAWNQVLPDYLVTNMSDSVEPVAIIRQR